MIVGRVVALWRYPIKSFLGEPLDRAWLTETGVEGDRGFALRDAESGHVMSAKRFSRLLEARARVVGRTIQVTLPNGEELDTEDADTSQRISAWLGRSVELVRPETGEDRPVMTDEDGTYRGRAGSFFDSSPFHVVTTSTLERLGELGPGLHFDARRFRPNVVLETMEPGFVEEEWIGQTLSLGGATVEITKPCSRCVITTHAQDDLLVERDVLRVVNKENDEHVGVYGLVRVAGGVSIGDDVTVS
jgi:hypothetical protein